MIGKSKISLQKYTETLQCIGNIKHLFTFYFKDDCILVIFLSQWCFWLLVYNIIRKVNLFTLC